MNKVPNILAGLIVLTGTIWFLQGINILPGSSMTGQPQWAVAGVVAWFVGIGLYLRNKRRLEDHSSPGSNDPEKQDD